MCPPLAGELKGGGASNSPPFIKSIFETLPLLAKTHSFEILLPYRLQRPYVQRLAKTAKSKQCARSY